MIVFSEISKTATILALLGLLTFLAAPVEVLAAKPKKPVQASSTEMEKSARLDKLEKELLSREEQIATREKELESIGKNVDKKLSELIALQKQVQAKLDELQAIKDKRFKSLIKTYSVMSATKLAPLLNKMDDPTVTEILRAMKSDQVAKILPKLEQKKAVNVSRLLGMLGKSLSE